MRTAGILLMAVAGVGLLAGMHTATRDNSGCSILDPKELAVGLVCWGSVLLFGAFLCIRGTPRR